MNADELKRYFKEVPGRILQIVEAEGQMLGRVEVLVRLLSGASDLFPIRMGLVPMMRMRSNSMLSRTVF
jgi:hypothetical protein